MHIMATYGVNCCVHAWISCVLAKWSVCMALYFTSKWPPLTLKTPREASNPKIKVLITIMGIKVSFKYSNALRLLKMTLPKC